MHLAGANANHTMDEKGAWRVPAQIAQGQGVSESLVRRVLKIEGVEVLPVTELKEGWDGRQTRFCFVLHTRAIRCRRQLGQL